MASRTSNNKSTAVEAEGHGKLPFLRWCGIFSESPRHMRLLTLAMIALCTVSLAFTQLGFFGLGSSDHYYAYIVPLLLPVVIASIFLGFGRGSIMGLFAGTVLYFHARTMPLDCYELTFVTPLSSIVLFTATGLAVDLLFTIVFRKSSTRAMWKTIVLIVLFSVAISHLHTLASLSNAFSVSFDKVSEILTAIGASLDDGGDAGVTFALSYLQRFGSIGIQQWADAGLMSAAAIASLFVQRLYLNHRGKKHRIYFVFNAWLGVAMAAAFLIASTSSFIGISKAEYDDMADDADRILDYMEDQQTFWDERVKSFTDIMQRHDVTLEADPSNPDSEDAANLYSMRGVLDSYDRDKDGIVLMAYGWDGGDSIFATNIGYSKDTAEGDPLGTAELFGADTRKAIVKSAESGTFERAVMDENMVRKRLTLEDLDSADALSSQMVYVKSRAKNDSLYAVIVPAHIVYASRNLAMAAMTFSTILLLAVMFVLISKLLQVVVIRKVNDVNTSLGRITNGALDEVVDVRQTVEFEQLSDDINETVYALKGWIAEAESRMDAELATAKAIQESVLPSRFPPFPDISHFDIYASMLAAREVGGDFYDFFLVGDSPDSQAGKLGFVIADVSGKGVPAALFMMNAKALVRTSMEEGADLGKAIASANSQLCEGNEEGMFVTLFAGVLDYETNHVDYVNAGHNPPLLWDAKSGSWTWIKEKSGLPLGLFEGLPYEKFSLDCHVGDCFLLYTDGVTEAMDPDDTLYGEERLLALANSSSAPHPRALVDEVRQDVAAHAAGAEQSDDITVLALEVGRQPDA